MEAVGRRKAFWRTKSIRNYPARSTPLTRSNPGFNSHLPGEWGDVADLPTVLFVFVSGPRLSLQWLNIILRHLLVRIRARLPLLISVAMVLLTVMSMLVIVSMLPVSPPPPSSCSSYRPCSPVLVRRGAPAIRVAAARVVLRTTLAHLPRLVEDAADFALLSPQPFVVNDVFSPLYSSSRLGLWPSCFRLRLRQRLGPRLRAMRASQTKD